MLSTALLLRGRGRCAPVGGPLLAADDRAGGCPPPPVPYGAATAGVFGREVMHRSGQNLFACYQCRRCALGCPVNEETDGVTPNVLIRMIVLGDRQSAFTNPLVWKCLSCNTCGTRCPNSINTGRVIESLKKIQKEEGLAPVNPQVVHFHTSCYNDSMRWGRVSEMGLMGEYQLRTLLENLRQKKIRAIWDEIRTQARFAWEMVRLRRLHLFFHTSRGRIEIKRLLQKSAGRKWI